MGKDLVSEGRQLQDAFRKKLMLKETPGSIGAVAGAHSAAGSGGANSIPTLIHQDLSQDDNKKKIISQIVVAMLTEFQTNLKSKHSDFVEGMKSPQDMVKELRTSTTSGTKNDSKIVMTSTLAIPLNPDKKTEVMGAKDELVKLFQDTVVKMNTKLKSMMKGGTMIIEAIGETSTKEGGKFFNKKGSVDLDMTLTITFEEQK